MVTRLVRAAGAICAVMMALPAAAADLRYGRPAPYAAPVAFNWTGAYFGANIGYQWGSTSNLATDPSGFAGGVQLGYNWQAGQLVFGVETDLQLSGAEDTFAAWKFSNPWFGTLRGRGGFAFSNVLVYVTAGLAYGGTDLGVGPLSESNTHLGWTLGAGMEVGFAPNWSAKAEFLYIDLPDQGFVLTGMSHGIDSGLLRLGVNYRF